MSRPRLRTLAMGLVAFVAGAVLSGAGAVWAAHQFPDVPTSNPFHDDIDWMVDNGVTTGYADGTFRPTRSVSRQELAAFLHRYNDRIEVVGDADNPAIAVPFYARTVTCPAGQRAVGGGGATLSSQLVLASSSPVSGGRAWQTTWTSRTGASVPAVGLAYHALCVPG